MTIYDVVLISTILLVIALLIIVFACVRMESRIDRLEDYIYQIEVEKGLEDMGKWN